MKTVICYFVWTMLFLNTYAQAPLFRNFKELSHTFQFLDVWIAPLNIEQQFKAFQREIKKHDLDIGRQDFKVVAEEREVDSLVRVHLKRRGMEPEEYMQGSSHPLVPWLYPPMALSKKVEKPFPQEWIQSMPSTLKARLEARAEEENIHPNNEFFSTYALVNNDGEVLSVYFRVDAGMLDLVREEDLQAIHDVIMGTPFNPEHFVFRYPDKKVMAVALKKVLDWDSELTPQEKLDILNKAYAKEKPAVHGVIKCISLHNTKYRYPEYIDSLQYIRY